MVVTYFYCVSWTVWNALYGIFISLPPFSVEVINLLANFLAHHPGIPALIVGDFNNYLDADLDKYSIRAPSHGLGKGPTSFKPSSDRSRARVVWRLGHPGVRCYSCHSVTPGGLSRIHLGRNDAMLPLVSSSRYKARTVSDHFPLCVQIQIFGIVKRAYSKINLFWLLLFPKP